MVAGLVAAVALTGCGGSADKPDAKAKPKISPRTAFLKEVHAHKDDFWPADENPAPTDAQIAAYPPRWCSAAAEGHSVDWMFDMDNMDHYYPVGDDWGTVIDNARTLVVLGVTAYCPKYRDQIVKDLQSKGEY
jgi:hypothetical protein